MTVTKYFNLEVEDSVVINKDIITGADVKMLAKALVLCSDATFENGKGTGDLTEIALLMFGDDLGIDRKDLTCINRRVSEYPFDSSRKLMSILSSDKGKLTVYTKGAIDNLLKISTHVLEDGCVVPITNEHLNLYTKATTGMTSMALRTLGAACKPVDSVVKESDMEKDLILLGLVGMIDPS